jgi:hypothetical protein
MEDPFRQRCRSGYPEGHTETSSLCLSRSLFIIFNKQNLYEPKLQMENSANLMKLLKLSEFCYADMLNTVCQMLPASLSTNLHHLKSSSFSYSLCLHTLNKQCWTLYFISFIHKVVGLYLGGFMDLRHWKKNAFL